MVRAKFEEAATLLNAEYAYKEKRVKDAKFASLTISFHELLLHHLGVDIIVYYEYGHHNAARVQARLSNYNTSYTFSFAKRSPYKLLFQKKLRSLDIQHNNSYKRAEIEEITANSGLEALARETLFEPTMDYTLVDNQLEIKMTYNLAFDHHKDSILPVVGFYKQMIELHLLPK